MHSLDVLNLFIAFGKGQSRQILHKTATVHEGYMNTDISDLLWHTSHCIQWGKHTLVNVDAVDRQLYKTLNKQLKKSIYTAEKWNQP